MAIESKTDQYRRRYTDLTAELDSEGWRSQWLDIRNYLAPQRGRYLNTDKGTENDGQKKRSKIINGSASDAIRTLAAGLQGGLTSPSRPWFRLNTADKDLNEVESVRWWLHTARDLMMNVYQRSNFYGSVHNCYYEIGTFGTNAMLIEEDFRQVIRCRPFTIGEFTLGLNAQYRVDTLYRRFSLNTRQMVEFFGLENVSDACQAAWKANNMGARWEVVHAIEPRINIKSGTVAKEGMPVDSVYYEPNGDPDKVLKTGGYKGVPFVAPRWATAGVATYGVDCPGMVALGDVKQLQKMEEKKLKALDKMVDPPMNAPSSMKGKGGTIISGGVNYIDVQQGQQGFSPTFQVNPDLQNIAFEIDRVERRIRNFHFNDLFLAVLNEDKKMTAFEVARRYEEKLMVLGSVLEGLQTQMLDTIIMRTFDIMFDRGLFPPLPKELEGGELKIEYISLLAQAQKMVGVTAIEQVVGFAGNLMAVNPSIVDKIDFDEAMDQYGDAVGIPPQIVRSDDKVAEIRAQKAQEAAQAKVAAMAQPAAQAAGAIKDLGTTPVGEATALEALSGMMGGAR